MVTSKLGDDAVIDASGDHKNAAFTWLYPQDMYAYEYYRPISYNIYYYELTTDETAYYDIDNINIGAYYHLAKTTSSVYGELYKMTALSNAAPYGATFGGWGFREDLITSTSADKIYYDAQFNVNNEFEWLYQKDIYFYAYYTQNTYSVTYDFAGGQKGELADTASEKVYYKENNIGYNEKFYVPNPVRNGYVFVGWKLNGTSVNADKHRSGENSGSTLSFITKTVNGETAYEYVSGDQVIKTVSTIADSYFLRLNKDNKTTVNFVAVWRPIVYTLVYDLKGGTEAATYPTTVKFDETANLPYPT